jgi:hypothetical protein
MLDLVIGFRRPFCAFNEIENVQDLLSADALLKLCGVTGALHFNARESLLDLAEVGGSEFHGSRAQVLFQPV